jgi:spermidine synthase
MAPARTLGASGFRTLVGLFVVSGAASLVDQVCFSKYLTYVVGATAHAVSAVLAAFMTGLMVGATVGGRLSAKTRRPLAAYGIAEILVGASVALAPLAFAALTPMYAGLAQRFGGSLVFLSLARWLVAFLVVAVPTAAMGATLPLVSAALAADDHPDARNTRERRLAVLYAANTFGGATGALIAAYALLPALGLSGSVYAAAVTSVIAGVAALVLDQATGYRLQATGSEPSPSSVPSPSLVPATHSPFPFPIPSHFLLLLSFPSGFLLFSLEALSTDILVSIIGTSAEAFRLIFAALGISVLAATALASRLMRRSSGVALWRILLASVVVIALTLPFRYDLPLSLGGLGVLVAFLCLVLPTAAIGAVLPLGCEAVASAGEPPPEHAHKRRVRLLYAANLFCGAAGALAGAYVALPALGFSTFVLSAAAATAFSGLVAIGVDRAALPIPTPSLSSLSPSWLAFLSFLSGFLVFAMEVVSTHLLVVIIGNSTYAFGLILAAFLLALFAGAVLARSFLRETGDGALGYSLAVSGMAVALTLPFWDDLGFAFAGLGHSITTFAGREAMRAIVAFGILVVPATCMGFTFPLVLQWAAARSDVGRLVGRLTAVNTAGAVFGALGTGYVVLPALGSQQTLLFVAVAFALAAALTALRMTGTLQKGLLVASAVTLLVALLTPRWDVLRLTAGTNVYFGSRGKGEQLLHVREDVQGGITAVTFRNGVRTLYTNGKFQGNDGWENTAQRYFAHYPCLFVPSFDRALIIGVGTGTTLGTLAAYPWKHIDVVDISPSIVDAARSFFAHTNARALEDPRVHLTIADGRNHLQVTTGRYSLITMELTSVWFAGAGALYSTEYYRLIRAHLTESGVFQQWVQLHHVDRTVLATLVNTLRREFEHVALFYGGGQGILVASPRPLQWSQSRSERVQSLPGFSAVLPTGRPLTVLTDDILVLDDGLDRFIADSARAAGRSLESFVSNDDNLSR